MAIELQVLLPDRSTPASPGYPGGSGKPSDPLTDNGTPFTTPIFDDHLGFLDALLARAGVSYSGNPDNALLSDRFEALQRLFAAFSAYVESSYLDGVYDIVAADVGKTQIAPFRVGLVIHVYIATTYPGTDPARFEFGTGGVTKNITEPDGTPIVAGRLQSGRYYPFIFRNDRFEIMSTNRQAPPEMQLIYTTPAGNNDGAIYGPNSFVEWPLELEGDITIPGASFDAGTHSFTLPHGYIYKIDMTGSVDDSEPSGNSKNRTYIAKTSAESVPLLRDVNNADPNNHTKHIKGYLDLKAELAPVQLNVFVRSQYAGRFGVAISTPLWDTLNVYFRGSIIQTDY
jgi:hypothetical protein